MDYRLPSDLYAVACRPALPKDTADVMAFTSRIWEGHDYVPQYWQTWLEDPNGLMAVAEYAGHVVGMSKISWVDGDQWWLQGLRVDPDHQGTGIASHLHRYMLEYWERDCQGVLRLATSSARLPVHHLCERTGFHKVGEYLSYAAPALEPGPGSFSTLHPDDSESALEFIRRSELFDLSFRLIDLGWQWIEPGAAQLAVAAREERVLWWKAGGVKRGLLVIDRDDDEDGSRQYIQLAGGDVDPLPEMLLDLRRLAGGEGSSRVAWMAPNREALKGALSQAGFTLDWDHSLYLYEKRLPSIVSFREA